ncbi:MAG TPA: DoxX family protein [Myxococcota bacterium]|nr:DoxX family protein [Myxococcota bacterium]
MTSDVRAQSRAFNIGVWVASGLLCALYLFASSGKLMSDPQAVEGFHKAGYSDAFRLFIGTCEFLGGIALLIPRLAFWAAIGLLIIMIGAVYTHVSTNDAAHMGPAVIALVLLAFIAYTRRPQALLLS